MNLDLANNIQNTKDKTKSITNFIDELETSLTNSKENSLSKREILYREVEDEGNFIPTIAKELNIPKENIQILREKMKDYLKEYSKHCGIVSYEGYDINTDEYYMDWYENGKVQRSTYSRSEFNQSCTKGAFYRNKINEKDPSKSTGYMFNEIKEAIKFSIEEQLKDGKKVKDINLFQLKNNIKNNENLKSLYEEKKYF